MNRLKPTEILALTEHRQFPLPKTDWAAYSEWNNMLLLHWKVDASLIKHLLPEQLSVDTFEGGAWVTIAVASIANFRNKFLDLIKQGLAFHQVLMQTYVLVNGKRGVFVFNQELERSFTKNIYQKVFKLQKGQTDFQIDTQSSEHKFFASNEFSGFKLGLQYEVLDTLHNGPFEHWLHHRFKQYYEKNEAVFKFAVHHAPITLHNIRINRFKCKFQFGGLTLDQPPDFVQYSPGIQKLYWPKTQIN